MKDYVREKFLNNYLILSIVGLILFLVLAATLPFKNRLFSLLYPKPPIFAQEGGWKGYGELVQKGKIKTAEQVMAVHLSYNVQNSPQVTIKNAQKRKGYAPPYPAAGNGYILQLLDNQNNVLYSINFEISNKIASDGIPESSKSAQTIGGIETAKAIELFFTLPSYGNASQIKLLNPDKKVIDTKDLTNVPVEDNQPNFRSITGDEFLKAPKDKLLNLETILVKDSYAASTDNTYVDFTFIGDSYSDLNAFHSDVNRFTADFLTREPYKSQSGRIRFNYVDNTSSLGCSFSSQVGTGGLDCDTNLIYQKISTAGVPYDTIYVIVNRNISSGPSGKANLNGDLAYGYNGTLGPQVFAHESGHSFGGLVDEYDAFGKNGVIDNKTYTNCYAGAPPAADWAADGITAGDYRLGCTYTNWYAPSQTSIMKTIDGNDPGSFYYNSVSRRYLNQKINTYASQPPAPQPTAAPNCTCVYSQNCTDSNSLPGTQTCNGVTNQSGSCVWDSSGACSANCTTCQSSVVPTPPPSCNCSYAQSCVTSSGQAGVQSCYGVKDGGGSCVWDNSGACNPSCTSCQTTQGGPLPTPTPVPVSNCQDNPSGTNAASGFTWKADCSRACGSNSDCPQNTWDPSNINPNSSNWCYGFSGPNQTTADWRCLMYIRNACPYAGASTCGSLSSGSCNLDSRAYSPDLGSTCTGCVATYMSGAISYIRSLDHGGCTDEQIVNYMCNGGISPQNQAECLSYKTGACAAYCGANNSIACNAVTLNVSPSPVGTNQTVKLTITGDASTYLADSFGAGLNCPGDWVWGGTPYSATRTCTSTSQAGTFAWIHSWRQCSGSFTNCNSGCTPVSIQYQVLSPTPTPIPAPAAPGITQNVSCVSGPYTGSEITISWNNPSGAPVSWVDISPNLYFVDFWNKSVSGLTSTTAPAGFSNTPALLPNIVYYVRLYNGIHSPIASFAIPSCPTPTPSPADTQAPSAPSNLTAAVVSSSQINLSWSPSTDNVGVTGYEVYRNNTKIAAVSTTSFGDASLSSATTYTYYVKAFDASSNLSPSSNTVSAATLNAALGLIQGTVYSSSGGIVAGAKITTKVGKTNITYYSNAFGVYSMPNLPPAAYNLTFQANAYFNKSISVIVYPGIITSGNAIMTHK